MLTPIHRLALFDLPADMQDAVHRFKLPISVAHCLAQIDHAAYREYLTRDAIANGATVRTVSAWVQHYLAERPASLPTPRPWKASPRSVATIASCAPATTAGRLPSSNTLAPGASAPTATAAFVRRPRRPSSRSTRHARGTRE